MQPQSTRKPRFCLHCGGPITGRYRPGQVYCSKACYGTHKARPLAERFWEKVEKRGPNDCWLWTGTTGTWGYGILSLGGHTGPNIQAHRTSWELAFGPIPAGLLIRHKCHTKHCVNPAHLELGTHSDNLRDRYAHGRLSRIPERRAKAVIARPQLTCPSCGEQFSPAPHRARSGQRHCSIPCAVTARYGPAGAPRFWRKVAIGAPNECWLWIGAHHHFGYGKLTANGKSWDAHRYAWVLTNGPVPEGQVVMHTCDVPGCCNPAHLQLGTQADNLHDCQAKGRFRPHRS